MANIKIFSYNCRGLHDVKKRNDVFQFLKEREADIYCLQDLHFIPSMQKRLYTEWNGECYFSFGESNSRGVGFFFKKDLDVKILNFVTDSEGNYVVLDLCVYSKRFTLINVYGPNLDKPEFFKEIFKIIEQVGNESYIICGDFNLVLDVDLDYCNYKSIRNNKNARNFLMNTIKEKRLFDPFRAINGDIRNYSWRRTNPIQQARLDFFLLTDDFLPQVRSCDINLSYRSDHSIVTLGLTLDNITHGKGLWKFNNSLLLDKEYLNSVNTKIEEIKAQYCLPVYNYSNLAELSNEEIQFKIDDQLFLETLLMEIRGKTISYSTFKSKNRQNKENYLLSKIQDLEKNFCDRNKEELILLKTELENIRQEKMNVFFVRSRANWVDNGEKATTYFCNLEKNHYTNKTIPFVERNDGKKVYSQNEILKETETLYKTLYTKVDNTSDFNIEDFLENANVSRLSKTQANDLEGLLSYKEVSETLKNMKNDKSPGSGGFTSNFFKVFWKQLGHFVVRSINYAFQKEELSITQKQGIITLIPKENKPRQFLKNWRPITLLNTVYKLASGTIANRLKSVLDSLIDNDQIGFIKGRYIGENTRLVYDIMNFTEINNIPGLLMLIDFEKAFDTLSLNFIKKTFDFFNFGPMFKKWISIFYIDVKTAVQLNGFLSNFFSIGRGCRQGDTISPYIFILCAEILAVKIRNSKDIKGIVINKEEFKISQFADDTSLFLDGSDKSLHSTLKVLHEFAHYSGLKVNFEKTNVIWIGSLKYSTRSIKTRWKLNWGTISFKLLGLMFHVDQRKMIDMNFNDKIDKIKNSITYWNRRELTPIGRITVVKSLLLPLLTHLFISLPNPDIQILHKINNLFFDFVWQGTPKIKRTIFIKDYAEGGLKMIDVYAFIKSLKLTWLRRLLTENKKWSTLVSNVINIEKLCNFGNEYTEKIVCQLRNCFWKDVLHSYACFISCFKISSMNIFLDMPLFYNHYFLIDKKPIYCKKLYDKGIRFVKDIMNGNGTFLSIIDLEVKTDVKINFLTYAGMQRAIKQYLKVLHFENEINRTEQNRTESILRQDHVFPIIPCFLKSIITSVKGAKQIYNIFIRNTDLPACQEKWCNVFEIDKSEWRYIHSWIFTTCSDTYLQWLQLRIVHRILGTNDMLYKMNITTSERCTFCKIEKETLIHLFWECTYSKFLIIELTSLIKDYDVNFYVNCKTFLLGYPSKMFCQYNIVCLETK